MITKEEFIDFINLWKDFESRIEQIEKVIAGSGRCDLFESEWYEDVSKMLDVFLDSHFTDDGKDLIYWWIFEEVDHIITLTGDKNLFNDSETFDVNELEDLWKFIISDKKSYIKNV